MQVNEERCRQQIGKEEDGLTNWSNIGQGVVKGLGDSGVFHGCFKGIL